MDGFKAFKYYMALKLHFTSQKYNVFTAKGRVRGSLERFTARNDRMIFEKLARQFKAEKEYIQYIASNFMYNNPDVVYDQQTGMANYKEYLRRRQSITKIFKDDLHTIADIGAEYDIGGGLTEYNLIQMYLANKITLETMVILDKKVNIVSKLKQGPMALLIGDELSKIEKSAGFVKFDVSKIDTAYMHFKEEQEGSYHG